MRAATGGAGIGGAGAGAATIAGGGAFAFRTFFVGALTAALAGGGFGTAAGLGSCVRLTVPPDGPRRGFGAASRAAVAMGVGFSILGANGGATGGAGARAAGRAVATAFGFPMVGACGAARRRSDGGTRAGFLSIDGGLSTMRLIGRPLFMRRISGKRGARRDGRAAGR